MTKPRLGQLFDCIEQGAAFVAEAADGSLVHIDDVPSGLACACNCPGCGRRMIARKGAVMRGPLVGLSEQELLDITATLDARGEGQNFFTVRTDPELVQHPVARDILVELQQLRRRASIVNPSLILAEAIERLNIRVIMAARHGNRNARALANLDALIERARGYSVSGLRAFIRDLQDDWEHRARAQEGRIDAAGDAVEIVTIHSAKGLEWPVVIPVNSTTELYRPDQFVHRQSDNSLHWMLGRVAPPELAAARAAESLEDANQRERIWYVALNRPGFAGGRFV